MVREAMTRAAAGAAALLMALVGAWAMSGTAQAAGPPELSRYDLAGGCFALRSEQTGNYVAKAAGAYHANAALGAADPFRMQATDLGKYLFYGPAPDFMARNALNAVAPAATPSDDSDWTISEEGSAFRIITETSGRALATGVGGNLETTDADAGGPAGLFTFDSVSGCADYPEIEVNVDGFPPTSDPGDEVRGTVEGHMHQMAFEFLGSQAHCGRPWHRFGAPSALQDCVDHQPNGKAARARCPTGPVTTPRLAAASRRRQLAWRARSFFTDDGFLQMADERPRRWRDSIWTLHDKEKRQRWTLYTQNKPVSARPLEAR